MGAIMNYLEMLVNTYQAQLAGAYIGCEQETLDKIEQICNSLNISIEDAFEQFSNSDMEPV